MRVMFSSTWGVGHVFPMVPLAQALVAAGHTVLWVAPEPAVGAVRAAGIPCQAGGLSGAGVKDVVGRMRALTAPLPPPERAAAAFKEMFGAWASPVMVDDLLPAARSFRPDVLVHEPAELAAPLVAALLDVACVTHSWGQAVPEPILAGATEAVASTWARHDRAVPEHAGMFRDGYLDLCPPTVQLVPTAHITGTSLLRPVPYSGPEDGSPALDLGDSADGPLVYITLGTVFSDAAVLQAAVDAAAETGARVIATVGPQGDPGVIERPTERVQVLSWVSQAALLPSTDLVISHAGSGTFLGALGTGQPQLCLPQAADQFRNAHAAVASGTGLALAPDQVTRAALGDAVRELLEQDRYRVAAAEVAHQIADMPHPAQVAEDLARAFA